MNYKTRNLEEYYFLLNFAKSKGFEVGDASTKYHLRYPLLRLEDNGLIISIPNNGYHCVSLSDFIKTMEEYKPPINIDGHPVQFNKGSIKVGCTTVSNELVREIVKNLVD